jgi:PAS domain S-box-containing protein
MVIFVWSLGLLLQGLLAWLTLHEYRWPYGTRTWRQGCACFFVAALIIMARHMVVLLSLQFDLVAPETRGTVELWLPLGTNGLLVLGAWRLTTVFHHRLTRRPFPVGEVTIDSHSVILAWDQGMERLMGWTATEALGQTLMQTMMPPQSWEAHRAAMARLCAQPPLDPEPERRLPVMARCKDGSELFIEITVKRTTYTNDTWQCHGTVRRLVVL